MNSCERSEHVPLIVIGNNNAQKKQFTYAFTIKDNRTNSIHYDWVRPYLDNLGEVKEITYETLTKAGLTCKLHLHGTLVTDSALTYRDHKRSGFMLYFKKVYSKGWKKYVSKQNYCIDWSVNQFSKRQ